MVADYCGISIFQVQKMDFLEYLTFRRDAFIFKMSKTEAGREYLENAWILTQTKPDKKKLREHFGKEG